MTLVLIIFTALLASFLAIIRRVYSFSSSKTLFGAAVETKYQRNFIQIGKNKNIVNTGLWFLIVVFSSASLILLENYLRSWSVGIIYFGFLAYIFIYLANYQPKAIGIKLAKQFSPWTTKFIQLTNKHARFIPAIFDKPANENSIKIYDDDDLLSLIEAQFKSPENKINRLVLKRIKSLIKSSDIALEDVMTKLAQVKKVDSNQEVGPVIIDELHKTGNKYFLVENKQDDELIGYIKLRDLTSLKQSGKIQSIMHKDLDYIEKDDDIFELIDGFLASSTPIFLVRNSGETVGAISIDDCLEILFNPSWT